MKNATRKSEKAKQRGRFLWCIPDDKCSEHPENLKAT